VFVGWRRGLDAVSLVWHVVVLVVVLVVMSLSVFWPWSSVVTVVVVVCASCVLVSVLVDASMVEVSSSLSSRPPLLGDEEREEVDDGDEDGVEEGLPGLHFILLLTAVIVPLPPI
jgi:hypothetical protein